jgi:ssDNA-binding Zn-finger/Zn-ribbon topoisomerase 1
MNKERKQIYKKTDGKCYYCGCELPKRWHVDHRFPKRKAHWIGNETMMSETCECNNLEDVEAIENKVPSCPRCNIRKSAFDVEQFRTEIQKQVERLYRNSNQFRLALDYELIEIKDKEVKFYFEKLNE